MPALLWKTDLFGICGTESDNGLKRFAADVRLIPQNDRPMSKVRSPSGPLGSALNRTEHTALWRGIDDTIACRKTESIEFGLDKQVIRRAHDCDLFRLKNLPLANQVAEHGGLTPRQQKF